ncbi:MAG: hypothetical protein FIB08_17480 [Candidatus Methanoperedens sp.]|nr:hypothetical protein [Candidatus Methanoperedens sp.]
MKPWSEYYVIQNSTLGSLALWTFAKEFYENAHKERGAPLPLTMIVLPMVFHKDTVSSIFGRVFEGGLYRAVGDDRTISAGLQQRMEAMADQTFKALNLAFAAGLLKYDSQMTYVIPVRISEASQVNIGGTKEIMSAARRLGYWFSTISMEQISILLKVRF